MRFIRTFGMILAMTASTFAPMAQAADWIKAESEHFIIYSDNSAKETRTYAGNLEKFHLVTDAFYAQMSDTVLPAYGKTRFNYFAKVSEFRIVRPDLGGHAFNPYLPCREGVQYFSTGDGQSNNNLFGRGELDPEIDLNLAYMFLAYNSHILHERFSKLPGWVSNGLNWYFMTAVFKDEQVVIGKPPPNIAMSLKNGSVDNLLDKKRTIPYADRIADKPTPPGMEDMAALEDWVMVSYLMADPERRHKLTEYLQLLSEETDSRTAYDKTINIDPATYADILKTYTKNGVAAQGYNVGALPEAAITVTSLPDYPAAVPLMDAALQTCPDRKDGVKLLDSLRKIAPQFPDDALTQTALARAEIHFGNPEAAHAYLSGRLKADPKDFEARFLMGRLYLALAEDGASEGRTQNYIHARGELGKAYTLNPASAPTLYLYARAFADQPDYPNANTMNALLLAQDYAGSMYDVYEAELRLRQGDYARAQEIIDRCLTYATKKWNKDRLGTMTAIRDGLVTRKPKTDLLPLFAHLDKIED
jgi:tetratricopeptide (TPR) repeat protein